MKSTNKKIVAFPRLPARRSEYELAFLPAAIEIAETPPSPIGRAIAATIIAVFVFAAGWASLGSIDIVAIAPGKIVPSGRTKLIQPFETGVVRAIHVRNGQSVKAGDVLIELDPTMSEAEEGHLRSDLVAAQLEAARLRAALAGETDFKAPPDANAMQIAMHRQFLIAQSAQMNGKLSEIDRQQAQKEAERASVEATIGKLRSVVPLAQERVDLRKYLLGKALTSKLTYLTEEQDLVGMQQDLIVQQGKLREADAALATLKETRTRIEAENRASLFDSLAKADEKAAALAQDIIKAERRTKLQLLSAPVDGVVQQLEVHTIGGVVTPAQPLAVLVPADSRLEIDAMVPNGDIGFVHAGQEADIKVDTFPFTRYGLLHGKILDVSSDAIAVDKPQDAKSNDKANAVAAASEPNGKEFGYAARVSLDHARMHVENGMVDLVPGMAVTVEIKTGSRRIISYLLSPLMKYKQEVWRER